ncbi:L-asparaginase [Dactylella cylindrospora]|nr:L-asparaginase [Dactylella cylindrospora]
MAPRRDLRDQSLYTTITRYSTGYEHPDFACIFVHAGAGYHSTENEQKHLRACRNACQAAMATLRAGGTSVDAVEVAIRILEDDPVTNSGFGSNLNFDGVVEADASIMDSFGRTGAIGAAPKIQNPIALARFILEKSSQPMSLRRVPPNFVVGEGAVDYALEHDYPVTPHEALIAHPARLRFAKWQKEIEYKEIMKRRGKRRGLQVPVVQASARPIEESGSALPPTPTKMPSTPQLLEQTVDIVTDTVGAICIDRYGRIAAGSSSGGIGMKQPGRVGPAALIGVGTFVKDRGEKQVATVVSGTGEHMLHALISSQAVNRLYDTNDELDCMKTIINDDFMGAQGYGKANVWGEPAIGVMSVKAENVAHGKRLISFIFGHNTDSFALASMCSGDAAPKTIMSRVTREPKLAIGGASRLVQMPLVQITEHTNPHDNPAKEFKRKEEKAAKRGRYGKRGDIKYGVVGGMDSLHIDGSEQEDEGTDGDSRRSVPESDSAKSDNEYDSDEGVSDQAGVQRGSRTSNS